MVRRKQPPRNRGAQLLASWRGSLSPIAACSKLSVNESALHAFLAGRRVPNLHTAKRIQDATNGLVHASSWLEPPKGVRAA